MLLTSEERSLMRKALLAAGKKTRGLDDDAIHSAFAGLGEPKQAEPAKPAEPKQAKPAEPKQAEPAKPADDSARLNTPSQPKATGVAEAIQAAIDSALQGFEPAAPALDEAAMIALIEKHSKAETIVRHDYVISRPDSAGEPVTLEGAHPVLAKALDVIDKMKANLYLVGPAGSGKTTLAMQAAQALGREFHFTGAIYDKFELLGFVDAGGKYHKTPLREALESETGAVFLLDEVDSSHPAPLVAFNAMLENGIVTFPDGKSFQVDRDKVAFIAAANTIGTGATRAYVGRFELDRAFLDRFCQLEMGYDEAIEKRMAVDAWLAVGGNPEQTNVAEAWANEVMAFRALLDTRNILALCTTRATRRGAEQLALGWPHDFVKSTELYKHLSADQQRQLGVN
jgi:DNA polymerase III delta prime subunit